MVSQLSILVPFREREYTHSVYLLLVGFTILFEIHITTHYKMYVNIIIII